MRAHLQLPFEGVIEPLPPVDRHGRRHPTAWAIVNSAFCLVMMTVAIVLWRITPAAGWLFAGGLAALEATRAVMALCGAYRSNYPVRAPDAVLAGLSCGLAAVAIGAAPAIAAITPALQP